MRDRFSIPLALGGLFVMINGVAIFAFYFSRLPTDPLTPSAMITFLLSLAGMGVLFLGMAMMIPLYREE